MYRQAYVRNGYPIPSRHVSGPYFDFKSECQIMDCWYDGKNKDTNRYKPATLPTRLFRKFFSILLTVDPSTPRDSVGDDNLETVQPLEFVDEPNEKFKFTWNTFESLLMLPRHDLGRILPVLTSQKGMALLAGQLARKDSLVKEVEEVVEPDKFHCKPAVRYCECLLLQH